jgi:hypothetical protein
MKPQLCCPRSWQHRARESLNRCWRTYTVVIVTELKTAAFELKVHTAMAFSPATTRMVQVGPQRARSVLKAGLASKFTLGGRLSRTGAHGAHGNRAGRCADACGNSFGVPVDWDCLPCLLWKEQRFTSPSRKTPRCTDGSSRTRRSQRHSSAVSGRREAPRTAQLTLETRNGSKKEPAMSRMKPTGRVPPCLAASYAPMPAQPPEENTYVGR